jgi:Tfp pilus assembly protein PilX
MIAIDKHMREQAMAGDRATSGPVARKSGVVRRQAGVVLVMALIALVTITLAALSLVRSVDTGVMIAGNQAFKESCLGASDVAIESASSWLSVQSATPGALDNDNAAAGYYATTMGVCDLTGNRTQTDSSDDVGWSGATNANCNARAQQVNGMPNGYSASYLITRMCQSPGSANAGGARCASDVMPTQSRFHGTPDYNYRIQNAAERARGSGQASVYYRIVTRVVCPRNSTSFVESIISLQ